MPRRAHRSPTECAANAGRSSRRGFAPCACSAGRSTGRLRRPNRRRRRRGSRREPSRSRLDAPPTALRATGGSPSPSSPARSRRSGSDPRRRRACPRRSERCRRSPPATRPSRNGWSKRTGCGSADGGAARAVWRGRSREAAASNGGSKRRTPRDRSPARSSCTRSATTRSGLGKISPRCLEEFHAWRWALEGMEAAGIPIAESVTRRMQASLRYAVAKAERRGLRVLPPELAPYRPVRRVKR